MKYINAILVLVVTLTLSQLGSAQGPVPGQPRPKSNQQMQPSAQSASLEQEFIKLEQQWMEAVKKQDSEALERIMASSFVHTSSIIPGMRTTKAQFIEASIQPTSRLGTFNLDQVSVRLVGDVAVVNAFYSQKARQGEVNFSGDYFLTDIWVKQTNRWQVFARNLIRAQKEPAEALPNQAANRVVANSERVQKPLPPCQKGCREQFDAASSQCTVKTSDSDGDSYDYDIPCMQNAQRILKTCNLDCRAKNKATREAKREARVKKSAAIPVTNATSDNP